MRPTLERRRMQFAYNELTRLTPAQRDLWERAVDGLGPEVQRAGLLQALAFLHRGPTKEIAEHLGKRIRAHLEDLGHLPKKQEPLLLTVRDLDTLSYMRITREIIALSVWLKRAVQTPLTEETNA